MTLRPLLAGHMPHLDTLYPMWRSLGGPLPIRELSHTRLRDQKIPMLPETREERGLVPVEMEEGR